MHLKSTKDDMGCGLFEKATSWHQLMELAVRLKAHSLVTEVLTLGDSLNLEHEFHYHLRGLCGVLSKLTPQEADYLRPLLSEKKETWVKNLKLKKRLFFFFFT